MGVINQKNKLCNRAIQISCIKSPFANDINYSLYREQFNKHQILRKVTEKILSLCLSFFLYTKYKGSVKINFTLLDFYIVYRIHWHTNNEDIQYFIKSFNIDGIIIWLKNLMHGFDVMWWIIRYWRYRRAYLN